MIYIQSDFTVNPGPTRSKHTKIKFVYYDTFISALLPLKTKCFSTAISSVSFFQLYASIFRSHFSNKMGGA